LFDNESEKGYTRMSKLKMVIDQPISYTSNFKKIITYYLFESPIEDTSARGTLLSEYGWKGSSRLTMLLRLMQAVADIDDPNWIICSRNEVKTNASHFPSEQIHMVCNNDKGKAKSIIYAVRNAFAHGSFNVKKINGKIVYIFENHNKGMLCAEITVTENTLLNWIKLFKTKPEHLTVKERKGKEIRFDDEK